MRVQLKTIVLCLLMFLSTQFAQEPSWQWAVTSSGSFPYTCVSGITEEGHVFLAGSFWGAFSTPLGDLSEANQSLRPVYFAQLSSSGDWNWANRCYITLDQVLGINAFCDLKTEVVVDETRNLYFVVNANGYADYTFGSHTIPGGSYRDLIVKVNSEGVTQWVKGLNGTPNQTVPRFTESLARINAIAIDRNSDLLIAGSCWGNFSIDTDTVDYKSTPFTTAFYAKMDIYGNVEWIKTTEAPSTQNHFAEINDIQVDQSNNYYFAGNYDYSVNFGNGNEVLGTKGDFVIETSTNGNVNWIFGTVGGSEARVTVNTFPSVYVSTKFYANFEVGNQVISKPGESVSCIYNLSKSGQFRWYRELEHSGAGTINVRDMDNFKQGNVLIAGDYGGSMIYDGTEITSTGIGDGFVMSIDEDGNLMWIKSFGGTGNDNCSSVSRNSSDNIYVSGAFDLTSYFDDISITMPDGDYDLYAAKLSYTTDVDDSDEIDYSFSLKQNYPNPFNPTTKITYSIPASSQVNLIIYDMLGREVETLVNEIQNAGKYEIKFNADGLSSGIYFYRLRTEQFSKTMKLLLLE